MSGFGLGAQFRVSACRRNGVVSRNSGVPFARATAKANGCLASPANAIHTSSLAKLPVHPDLNSGLREPIRVRDGEVRTVHVAQAEVANLPVREGVPGVERRD